MGRYPGRGEQGTAGFLRAHRTRGTRCPPFSVTRFLPWREEQSGRQGHPGNGVTRLGLNTELCLESEEEQVVSSVFSI